MGQKYRELLPVKDDTAVPLLDLAGDIVVLLEKGFVDVDRQRYLFIFVCCLDGLRID